MRLFLNSVIFSIIFSGTLGAQNKIKWMTWEEAIEKNKVEKKKIFVDVYTDWCGWCKKMDMSTLSKDKIAIYMNKNYYSVKLDAQHKENITYKGVTYKFVKQNNRGYHELAAMLLNGQMSFPSIVFLDEDLNLIQAIPGYQDELNFEMISTYFGQDFHKNLPWNRYVEAFQRNNEDKMINQVKKN